MAAEIRDHVIPELRTLAALAGIGVIRLDQARPSRSRIVIPACEHEHIHEAGFTRRAFSNLDFIDFAKSVRRFRETGRIRDQDWDYPA